MAKYPGVTPTGYTGGGNSSTIKTRDISVQDFEKQMKEEYENQKKQIEKLQSELKNLQKTKNMSYKVFNVKDLLSEIQYEGVRKGTKTESYLEDVIKHVNLSGKYTWVQFFQLVDVFYVVVEINSTSKPKNTVEEIKDHYQNVSSQFEDIPVSQSASATVIKSEPVTLKTSMPWKNNK